MRDRKRSLWVGFLLLASLLALRYFPAARHVGVGRPGSIGWISSCPERLPGAFDAQRLVEWRLSGRRPDARQSVLVEDLEELLLSGGYAITADSGAASRCVAWRLELELADGGEIRYVLRHFGQVVEDSGETPPQEGPLGLRLRSELASWLALGPEPGFSSLRDPPSPAFAERMRSMLAFAEGRTGEAAAALQRIQAAEPADLPLRFRLGKVQASWGGEMLAARSLPIWPQASSGVALEVEARKLLVEARRHLDEVLRFAPKAPLALLARGNIHLSFADESSAEGDFQRAIEAWPTFPAATEALVRLRLERGAPQGLEAMLRASLQAVGSRPSELRAALLVGLSRTLLLEKRSREAMEALDAALEAVPLERRKFRNEILGLRLEAQAGLRSP